MEQKVYILDGRQFRTESDYACAMRDKDRIDKLRRETDFGNREALKTLRKEIREGRYNFLTILERDFLDEVEEQLKKLEASGRDGGKGKRTGSAKEQETEGRRGQPVKNLQQTESHPGRPKRHIQRRIGKPKEPVQHRQLKQDRRLPLPAGRNPRWMKPSRRN